MDRVAAGDDRGADDGGGRQVRALGIRRPDADGFVGELDRQGFAIGLAVGDDGLDTERAARPEDAEGDLAAIGDEDLAEHASGLPARAGGPSAGSTGSPGTACGARVVRGLDDDELLAVLDGLARLDEARADDPVDRGDDFLWDPEHVDGANTIAGPDAVAGPALGPGLVDTDGRRGRDRPREAVVLGRRRGLASLRARPDGDQAGGRRAVCLVAGTHSCLARVARFLG